MLNPEQFRDYIGKHISYAFASIIIYLFTQTIIMFYFIGSGKKIKETILKYNLDKSIYKEVIKIKKELFPHLTMNILFMASAFILGGAVHTVKNFNIWWHSGLFIFSIIHYLKLIFLQIRAFKADRDILLEIGKIIANQKEDK